MRQANAAQQFYTCGRDQVIVLQPSEPIVLDQDRVVEMFVDLGELGAQQTVSATLEDIRARVDQMSAEYAQGTWRGLVDLATEVSALAGSIGFISCKTVAESVMTCAADRRANDVPSLMARLNRVCAIPRADNWGMQGLSG
ncbi:hypothetical protein [Tropicimonas sp. S265A]|uniref:hypothetical protein n=1 Tax=Tropicimonas sp. S265A TaxID=3415134 RepID=UPI003C7B4843